jgi:TetR/AcrR family transcriptional regulator, cholesterol catabolism regulator
MQDIAEAVGLYKGSLYHYIASKEDLLARVFERALGSLLSELERIASDTSLGPTAQLHEVIRAHVGAVATNLDALTVYLHEWRALADDSLATVRAQRERYASLVYEIVGRGQRLGEFHVPDVRIATLGVLGMCNWLCQWYKPSGRLGPAEIADHFATLVLDGLRRDRRPGQRPSASSLSTVASAVTTDSASSSRSSAKISSATLPSGARSARRAKKPLR